MVRLGFVAAALAAVLTVSGCGYRPLYGERTESGGPGVSQLMAEVQILPIAERRGQILYNHLLDRMNPRGQPARPRYALAITTTEDIHVTDARADGTATRSDVVVNARLILRDVVSDAVVFVDRTQAVATFNLLTARFASVASEDEARRRVMEQVADQVTTQIALFLNRRHGGAPTAKAE